jgi:hypothetical protein
VTVLYDATTEQQRSTSAATATFNHVAGAGVKGILVGFVRGGAATTVSAVSYGGTSLVQVNKASDTTTEPGSAEWWYASHETAGSQAVTYAATGFMSNVHVVAITVKGDASVYVQGSQTKAVDNTTSHSVSLTTGYASGMAFGAFFGGAAAPASLSYATDRVLVHDWDFGAFYSEFFRQVSATSPGVANPMGFGGNCPTSDDLAFAAVYLTDGVIAAGRGQVATNGLAPSLLGDLVLSPASGLVSTVGQIPVMQGSDGVEATALPGVGSVVVNTTITGPVIYVEPGPVNTHAPTLYTELQQTIGVGLVTAVGQIPTEVGTTDSTGTALPGVGSISTVGQIPDELRDLTQTPSVGLVIAAGLAPSELRELTQTPSVGLVTINGLTPTELPDRAIGPQQGLATAQGLAPTLYLERTITPAQGLSTAVAQAASLSGIAAAQINVGAVTTEGRAPTLYLERSITPAVGLVLTEGQAPALAGDGEVFGTALPEVGLVSLVGLAPTLSGTVVDETRGHPRRRRVVRRARIVEEPSSGPVQAIVLPPDVPAYFDPPTDRLAGFNTLADALEVRLTEIEHKRAAIARRRREEEEIVRFLLRVA